MSRLRFALPSALTSFFLLLVSASIMACGSPSGYLKSLTVNPSTAEGHVQFIATGTRVNDSTVSPVSALWWNVPPWNTLPLPSPGFTIGSNGNATCLSEGGTFPVWATAPANPNTPLSQMTATTPQVVGTAQITCP